MFKTNTFQEISLNEWLARTPQQLVASHLHLDKATLDAIPKDKSVIVPR
jgi:oxalate decarboxylase